MQAKWFKLDLAMPCTVQVEYYQTIIMRLPTLIIGDYYCKVMSCSLELITMVNCVLFLS